MHFYVTHFVSSCPLLQVVELVINNMDEGEHPIHMHGRRMYVIARGKDGDGNFNVTTNEVNEIDPIVRDSVTVAGSSYIGETPHSTCFVCVSPAVHCNFAQQPLPSPSNHPPSRYLNTSGAIRR